MGNGNCSALRQDIVDTLNVVIMCLNLKIYFLTECLLIFLNSKYNGVFLLHTSTGVCIYTCNCIPPKDKFSFANILINSKIMNLSFIADT